jgi:hypothetical protein
MSLSIIDCESPEYKAREEFMQKYLEYHRNLNLLRNPEPVREESKMTLSESSFPDQVQDLFLKVTGEHEIVPQLDIVELSPVVQSDLQSEVSSPVVMIDGVVEEIRTPTQLVQSSPEFGSFVNTGAPNINFEPQPLPVQQLVQSTPESSVAVNTGVTTFVFEQQTVPVPVPHVAIGIDDSDSDDDWDSDSDSDSDSD